MKRVVIRFAMDDNVDVQQFFGSLVHSVRVLHGAMIVGGENSPIIVASVDVADGKKIAQFLAGDDGGVELA